VNTDYPNNLGAAIDGINRRLKGNLVDNGAFQVWQRGTSVAAAGGTKNYTTDRWAIYRSGFVTGATVSRQTGSQAQYCARVQRDNGNASTANLSFVQHIETVHVIPLRGKTITLAFRARMGALYSPSGQALISGMSTGTGTDEAQDFAYTGLISNSLTRTLTTTFADFSQTLTVPANASEIAISFGCAPLGAAGATDYFELEEVQLVVGDYAGNFPYRSYPEELLLCQRHYETSYAPGVTVPTNGSVGFETVIAGGAVAAASQVASVRFAMPKRTTTPAVRVFSHTSSTQSAISNGAGTDLAANTGVPQNANHRMFQVLNNSVGAATPTSGVFIFQWDASADI
jgi:hypothetical protein